MGWRRSRYAEEEMLQGRAGKERKGGTTAAAIGARAHFGLGPGKAKCNSPVLH